LGQAQQCGWATSVLSGYTPQSHLIIGSPKTEILTNKNTQYIRFHSKDPHTITKMNEKINRNSTVASR
jgi:hypothetical protein